MKNQNMQTVPGHHSAMPPIWLLLLVLVGVIEIVAPLVSRSLAAVD
jgi:hypothetical protein